MSLNEPGLRPTAIMETCLYAPDLAAAEEFYVRVLQLPVIAREPGRHVFFRCGAGVFLVFNADRTSSESTTVGGATVPLHGARGPGHVAFQAEASELPRWRERLREANIPIESEVRWPQGGVSIYFRDPAGNSVELVTPEIWQPKNG